MIPVNEPLLKGNEKKYLIECIDSGWISSEGPFVKRFETEFSKKVNRKFGVAVSSGTAALDIAIEALRLKEGDEIIMPTFTIISCINQIIRSKIQPVFVDSDPVTWNMDVTQIESKITDKTKAIMIVHIYGLPVDVKPILELSKKYNLKVIEDAAEMIGQTYNGKPCGSFGDVSIFSFYPNKHITTGEGGMVVTNDEMIAEKAKSFRNLCFKSEKRFVHFELGWNYRMTNLQAAVGIAQLEKLDEFIIKKRWIGKLYSDLLKDVDEIQLPLEKTEYAENIYWVYGLVIKKGNKFNAVKVMNKLREKGIGTRPFFYPLHKQPVFNQKGLFLHEYHPVAERLSEYGFYIPSGLNLTKSHILEVVRKIKEVFSEK